MSLESKVQDLIPLPDRFVDLLHDLQSTGIHKWPRALGSEEKQKLHNAKARREAFELPLNLRERAIAIALKPDTKQNKKRNIMDKAERQSTNKKDFPVDFFANDVRLKHRWFLSEPQERMILALSTIPKKSTWREDEMS